MKIIRKRFTDLSHSEKNEIDQFVDLNHGLVFHYTNLNGIVSDVFKSTLSYLIAYKEKEVIGICPVHTVRKGILRLSYSSNGSFEIPYGGWVFDDKLASYEHILKRTPVYPTESLTLQTSFLKNLPESMMAEGKKFETGIIDLQDSLEDIWQNCVHSKRRNMIRKAERSGIEIKHHGSEGFPIFSGFISNMKIKAGLSVKPSEFYKKIVEEFCPENGVILIAYKDGVPVTGNVIIGNKNVMHYWLGASTPESPNFGQGELLQWEAIRWAKSKSVNFYDLCVIEPERLPHIAQFKMGFTKKIIPYYCISMKHDLFTLLNKIQNAVKH